MRWMILGGGGCFGVHLAKHLLSKGDQVFGVGRGELNPPWDLGVLPDKNFAYYKINISDPGLFEVMAGAQPDIIVNFAALAYATSWDNPAAYYETNLVAVARITEWLSHNAPWLHRFVQIGSSEVYGSTSYPADEDARIQCSSPYAVSKLAADLHVLSVPQVPSVVIRPSNCYGEGQLLYRLIPRAIWCVRNGKRIPLQGGGSARKTWMHAEDLAKAIVTVVTSGRTGQVYNAGRGDPISNAEIMGCISELTGVPVDDFVGLALPREGEDSCYRITSFRTRMWGWHPSIDLMTGIQRVIRWMDKCNFPEPKDFVLRP